ncbi:MAG: alpha/beta hydrolase domain-containing protein, partial [Candidatus Rokuibacteriota bacterium]
MPVTRFELDVRRPLADGRAFGDVGPYEELRGRLHLAVDPANPANRAVTDLALAPRDAAGRVLCAADVSILVPVDRTRASGRVIVDVVNR